MKKNKSENIHKYELIFITKSIKNFRSSCKISKFWSLILNEINKEKSNMQILSR